MILSQRAHRGMSSILSVENVEICNNPKIVQAVQTHIRDLFAQKYGEKNVDLLAYPSREENSRGSAETFRILLQS